ncbi:MAG: RNA polymerase factor sigma-54 [Candidatus Methylacidiphilales bacterium]|nr:RNA polymerase factor sigma-54 [Candidatus Methylacidiphilales bacterium]
MAGIGLQQNLSLGQTLSPQMQQSLHFLQAPVLELRSLIQQEIETNPLLEEAPPEPATEEDEEWDDRSEQAREDREDWRDYFSQNRESRQSQEDAQARRQFFFDSQVKSESLGDHLIGQLILTQTSESVLKAAEEIIGNLSEDGFLTAELTEIAAATRLDLDEVMKALRLVQSFHPAGVGARDLRESLLIQLERRGKDGESLEAKLVSHDLDRLARKRFQELARDHKVTQDRLREAAHYISKLEPHPGAAFSPDQPQNVVQSEAAFIKDDDGSWTAVLNNDSLPYLRISDTYKDLVGGGTGDAGLKDYLKDRIRAGKFLIKCLQQRQQTIENILLEIIKRQRDYLEHGNAHLKPMTMSQVAEAIGVHETTVSRAVASKYVTTPHGVVPMKFFFTSGYMTAEGQTLSNTSVKDTIGELIARENPRQPLSDSEIVDILKDKGVDLARRTVAKYRSELNILPSNLRREH